MQPNRGGTWSAIERKGQRTLPEGWCFSSGFGTTTVLCISDKEDLGSRLLPFGFFQQALLFFKLNLF